MITLDDFLYLAMDEYYAINIYDTDKGIETAHQVELRDIDDETRGRTIASWDIDYYAKDGQYELTINIE